MTTDNKRMHRLSNPSTDLASLSGLRSQLTARIGLLVAGAAGVAAWLALIQDPFLPEVLAALLLLLLAGIGASYLADHHLALVRHLLTWGLTLAYLLVLWHYPQEWLPYLSLLLVLIGAMLAPGSEFVIGSTTALLLFWLSYSGVRIYPLPPLLGMLTMAVVVAWLLVRSLYTALQWVWDAQRRAERLLQEVRQHRAELSQTLQSYQLANNRLRRMERELYFAHQQAEKARRHKEQFAANVSHELRTPLNLIHGFSEMMHRSPEVYGLTAWPPTLRRDVYQIYRSSRHLLSMIDDILALSRFEHAEFALVREATDVGELLHTTAEIAGDLFRTSPVSLRLEVAPDLPLLEVDQTRIRQVMLNLLNNALRFTESGAVIVGAEERDDELVIWVSDSGPGIPADKLEQIFEEFYQLDLSLSHAHGGAGLGLAICRRFVEAHDGRVWAESTEGDGSTFFVALPIPEQRLPLSRLHAGRESSPAFDAMRPVVLVADADPAVVSLIARHVEGYEVRQVADISDLAEAVDEYCPQAVIYNRPDPGASTLLLPSFSVPVIECSLPRLAWDRQWDAVKGVLAKPLTAQQLLDALVKLDLARERPYHVLVIDDDRGFCQLITRILEASGEEYQVSRAYDGAEGLEQMRAHPPDLILLDLVMPVMDGFTLLEEMQQDSELAHLPVLLLTATNYAPDVDQNWGDRIVIHRGSGLRAGEVLRWLPALVQVLGPYSLDDTQLLQRA
jgi:signal transduction histidine kinase/CheY-like chemotaxis protein